MCITTATFTVNKLNITKYKLTYEPDKKENGDDTVAENSASILTPAQCPEERNESRNNHCDRNGGIRWTVMNVYASYRAQV